MIRSNENRSEKRTRPFCQVTGCFEHADFYVVLKETEEADYYEVNRDDNGNYEKVEKSLEFDGFKIILYLCSRHDDEFKYLIIGSELRIARRCNLLRAPEIP
ncbi:hypothetical protein [Candidatus Nitrososphaera gargensis]|uniref:hypothetical protein n=1 Tax=Candidatus Nitrososphaera gargensis TaxID=497727 RepID=UPI0011E4E2EC|nr:hypothetical protein [Candidatus Nitrososphaera gargensis]